MYYVRFVSRTEQPTVINTILKSVIIVITVLIMLPSSYGQGLWSSGASLPTPRRSFAAAELNGFIYTVGGSVDGSSNNLTTVEAFDPATNSWSTITSLSQPRDQLTLASINSKLYAAGGYHQGVDLGTLEVYDPAFGTWTMVAPMPTSRRGAGAAAVNGKLYVIGGSAALVGQYNVVEEYDPSTDTWTTKAPMPTARTGLGVGVVNGIIYAIGGVNSAGSVVATVEAFDPVSNSWTTKASMFTARWYFGTAVINDSIYAIGGDLGTGTYINRTEVYYPTYDFWTARTEIPTARALFPLVSSSGVLYAIGGLNSGGTNLGSVEKLTPFPAIQAPGFQPSGLAYDGGTLYVAEKSGPRTVFKIDPSTGAVLGSAFSGGEPNDLVYDGAGHIFVADNSSRIVLEKDLVGNVLNVFPVPFRPSSIAFDGTNLYVGDQDTSLIRVTDRFGNFIRNMNPGIRSAGMVYDPAKSQLWVLNMTFNTISLITKTGAFVAHCYSPRNGGGQGLGAVTLVGDKLYIAEVTDPIVALPPNVPGTIFIVDTLTIPCTFGPNATPTANAGPDQTVDASSAAGANVNLDGSASSDPDGDTLTYSWKEGAVVLGTSPTINVTLPIGMHTITLTVDDGRGQTASDNLVVTVTDGIAPSIECGTADGQWHSTNVDIICTASDSGSGLTNPADASFTLSTHVNAGFEDSNAATNTREICDAAGNCSIAGPITGNKIDRKAPNISITAPASGVYLLNQIVAASYSCSDGGSATATCAGPVANGSNIDTASPGSANFTVNATDNVGNSASQSLTYSVAYGVIALYDQTKVHKSGSTIPIKIQIVDANGVNHSSSSVALQAITVGLVSMNSSGTPEDAGNANPDLNFRYDSSLEGYIFNLTTSGYAPGTYELNFVVGGGTTVHVVQFRIRP